ncbi:MAG: helicase-associated domain-containing protein, partial [Ktedonobacteraceae bacterium]|nr:helicase-associated domain-containing protein [Ktedonobacteraceae bacterium]
LYAPYLLFPRQYGSRAERYTSGSNPYGWDFRLRRGWLTHREGWHLVEGGFIRSMLNGPLQWLGVVELNHAQQVGAFRFASGAENIVSDSVPANDDLAWGKLIVQPSFELIALAPVSEAMLLMLDRFAERVSLERVAQYRLTRASVTRSIQKGMFAEQILAELARASGSEVPQNVSYTVSEWERQARRIELWRGTTLLEVDDEALLDELFADAQARDLFQRRLAPGLVEIAHQRLPEVLQLLWQRDYLPAITPAPTEQRQYASREPQWQLLPDGLLRPLYAVPDIYLVEEVARFSEHDATTGWQRITAAALRRALEAGDELEAVLRFLQRYCAGGIPGSLLIRLKLWGGGYGSATTMHVESVPLLRLSEQMLRDIQEDADIQQLLGDEVEEHSRLVRVSPSNLERLLELLRERGFTINE